MSHINTLELITDVLATLQDDSETTRSRLLTYANMAFKTLHKRRDWKFLHQDATITLTTISPAPSTGPSRGVAPYPADYARFVYIDGADFTIGQNDRLSKADALRHRTTPAYIETPDGIAIIPAATGEILLTYIPTLPTYDSDETTLFPSEAEPYLIRHILTLFYEYDMDERWSTSSTQTGKELAELILWDNRQRALPHYNSRGKKP